MKTLFFIACAIFSFSALTEEQYKDGQFPPPKAPVLQWDDLLSGKLEDHFADMNCALHSPTFTLKPDPDNANGTLLHLSKSPTGLVRSQKQYENFILECEWRHLTEAPSADGTAETTGNSGLYVWADGLPTPAGNCFTRGIEVQVCNLGNGSWYTSHGDLFPIWGAKMTPDPRFGVSGDRSMPIEFRGSKTGAWNKIRVTCIDGMIQEEVNGALVSAGFHASPRKGYVCIESEGGPIDFRNFKIHELPESGNLKPEDVALALPEGSKVTCLYNGVDLEGWEGDKKDWKADDHELKYVGKEKGDGLELKLPDGNKDFTLQLDFNNEEVFQFLFVNEENPLRPIKNVYSFGPVSPLHKGWSRAVFLHSKGTIALQVDGKEVFTSGAHDATQTKFERSFRLLNPGHEVSFTNIILIENKEKK